MPQEANPETGAITDDQSAVAHVAGLLEPTEPTEQDREKKPKANQAEPEAEVEAEGEDAPEAEPSSEQEAETEPGEGEGEELPDTLEGLAEALGMEPDELAGYLKVPAKRGGKVEHVTLADAIKGQQLDADYRQKTMELSEQRRQLETQAQEATQRWQEQTQRLDTLIQSLEGNLEAEPTGEQMAQLLETDPKEYMRITARVKAQQERIDAAKKARDEELSKQEKQFNLAVQQYRSDQQRLLVEKVPELSDPDKLATFERNVATYLKGQGFTDQDVAGFFGGPFDHRHVLLVRDAMRYRALQNGKKGLGKRLQALPKVQKPGASPSKATNTDKLVASRNRLKQLKRKGSKTQQNDAAVELVKRMLG